MIATNNTYIPDMSDWVSYYGDQSGSGSPSAHVSSVPSSESHIPYISDCEKKDTQQLSKQAVEPLKEAAGNKHTCNSCGLIDEMSTDIQVLSPVQMAVNQAMATKRRRISKKKRKSGGKKSGRVVKRPRTKKPKRKRKRQKKIKKAQRDIFNY